MFTRGRERYGPIKEFMQDFYSMFNNVARNGPAKEGNSEGEFPPQKFGGIGHREKVPMKKGRRKGGRRRFGAFWNGPKEDEEKEEWMGFGKEEGGEKWGGCEAGAADLCRNGWPKEKAPKNRMKTEWRRRRREGRRMSSRQRSRK
jgi:hypothetical protein